MYGFGLYIGAISTPSAGYLVCSLTYVLILLFHGIDLLYKREFRPRVNGNYWILALYVLSMVASLVVAIHKNLPDADIGMFAIRSVLIIAPLHAFMVVYVYNMNRDDIAGLTLAGLSALLAINLFGYYVLGMRNALHSIDGRINFPFVDGLYSGASLIAVINVMLVYELRRMWSRPITAFFIMLYLSLNSVLIFFINSRLVTMVLLLVVILIISNVARIFRGVFVVSIFTIPLVLNASMLIYTILNLPVFSAIMQRVDLLDVVTFNGRAFLWRDALDWLLIDQRGLIFGNGYKGHYFLQLFGDVIKFFDLGDAQHMHAHSTTMEIAISQGVVGLALFLLALYKAYCYYKREFLAGRRSGALFPVIIFILFIAHLDGFVYLDSLGGMLFIFLVARLSVTLHGEKDASGVSLEEISAQKVNGVPL